MHDDLDVDVLRHPVDQAIGFREARSAYEHQMNVRVALQPRFVPAGRRAEVFVMDFKRAQTAKQLGNVNVFLGSLDWKAPQQAFR
jgi:hypothetical protein